MWALFAFGGIFLAACLVIVAIVLILCAFFGNIIIFDSIVMALVAGICGNAFLSLHPALCLLFGVVLFIALIILHNTNVGFWVIGGLATAFYAFLAGTIAHSASDGDWIWVLVVGFLAFLLVAGLHFYSRAKFQSKNPPQ